MRIFLQQIYLLKVALGRQLVYRAFPFEPILSGTILQPIGVVGVYLAVLQSESCLLLFDREANQVGHENLALGTGGIVGKGRLRAVCLAFLTFGQRLWRVPLPHRVD